MSASSCGFKSHLRHQQSEHEARSDVGPCLHRMGHGAAWRVRRARPCAWEVGGTRRGAHPRRSLRELPGELRVTRPLETGRMIRHEPTSAPAVRGGGGRNRAAILERSGWERHPSRRCCIWPASWSQFEGAFQGAVVADAASASIVLADGRSGGQRVLGPAPHRHPRSPSARRVERSSPARDGHHGDVGVPQSRTHRPRRLRSPTSNGAAKPGTTGSGFAADSSRRSGTCVGIAAASHYVIWRMVS